MANDRTEFSFMLDLPPAAIDYVLQLHERLEQACGLQPDLDDPVHQAATQGVDMAKIAVDLCCKMERSPRFDLFLDNNEIWIRSVIHPIESGSPENVALFLQTILQSLDLDEAIGFTWACSCDGPRFDTFDGGAVVLTKDSIWWNNATSWMQTTLSQASRPKQDPLHDAAKTLLEHYKTPNQLGTIPREAHEALIKAVAEADHEIMVREYVAGQGLHCPVCKGDTLEGNSWDADESYATHEMTCNDCGAGWKDLYTLTSIIDLEGPHE